jgi:hypothetical protein
MTKKYFILALYAMALLLCPSLWFQNAFAQKHAASARFDTAKEKIGGLRLGLSENDTVASIPCTPKKLKEILEGATGDYVQTWQFAACGIVLKMSSPKKGAPKSISAITLTKPATLATGRGIRIGSTEQEVLAAYGRYRDADGDSKKGKQFVAGSIFDGMIFDFQDGAVVRIFLGAAAE